MSHAEAGTSIGETVTEEALETDPYPIYARLREQEPVSWVPAVQLWLVTRWADVDYVDKHPEVFTGETEPSTLNRTFGRNLLGSEGAYHDRIRSIIYPAFRADKIGHYPDEVVAPIANDLVDGFAAAGRADLMADFASPLSVRVLKRESNCSSAVLTRLRPPSPTCAPAGTTDIRNVAGACMRMFSPGVSSSLENRTTAGSRS